MVDPTAPRNQVNGPNEVRATGPGGWGLTVRGREGILLLILAAAFGGLVWVNARGFARLENGIAEQRAGRIGAVSEIARDHRELLCLLALNQDERRAAVRGGDVCGFLFGTLRRPDR